MATIKKQLTLTFKQPNIAESYGPYTSVSAAHAALSEDQLNVIGMTVGIEDSITHTIEEYWYQGGTNQENLVKKQVDIRFQDIVDGLAYGGIVGTSASVTPDTGCYYITNGAGTYTAFGGVQVPSNDHVQILTYDGTQWQVTDLPWYTYSYAHGRFDLLTEMGGATASQAGVMGFVPAPAAGDQEKILQGDGTWAPKPSNGQDGADGFSPYIDSNSGNWVDGDGDTGVHAQGPQGVAGQNGADAVNPFKGWYNAVVTGEAGSLVITSETQNLPANPVVGDYAYVKTWEISGTAPSQTETPIAKIYECTIAGSWSDSGRTADTSNVQTFASSQEVNEVHIVNDLTTGGVNNLTNAESVKELSKKSIMLPIPITLSGSYLDLRGGIGTTIPTNLTTHASYNYFSFPCVQGDIIIVNGTGGGQPRLWGFIDSSDKIIAVAEANASENNLKLIAPYGTSRIIINDSSSSTSYYISKDSLRFKLDGVTDGAQYFVPQITETLDKFINAAGNVSNGNGFAYTSGFYAERGSKIILKARGYETNIAMIAKVISEGVSYTKLVTSTDSNVKNYEYVVTEDGYYACSYDYTKIREIIVIKNTPLLLAQKVEPLIPKVNVLEDKAVGITTETPTISVEETGKFISINGYVASSAPFKYSSPVFIKGGSLIIMEAAGYDINVAMISNVIENGKKYKLCVPSIDNTLQEYKYFVEEDGYYAFSWNGTQPMSVKCVVYPVANHLHLQDNLYYGIPTIGIIGDSLSSGTGYNPISGTTQSDIQYAWWKVLERNSGNTYQRFCEGGMSTRSFITNPRYGLDRALTEGNECQLYIIALGVNDRTAQSLGPSYLGSVSDIDVTDPDNNADTYYGNYARIIQKITEFNDSAKFMLFTDPRTDGDFNDAVRTIASMFDNCYLVDLWKMYSPYFTTGGFYRRLQDQTAHYPAMAYQSMAKLFEFAINTCISNYYSDFVAIQFN